MDIHNPEAIGFLKLHYTPTEPNHAVRKEDLDALKSETNTMPIFITGVGPQAEGNVGNKQYADTVPPNLVIVSCVSDTEDLRLYFEAESRVSFTPPTIEARMGDTVIGVPANIDGVDGNSHLFRGYIDITLTESGLVTVTSSAGSVTTVDIIVATLGPVISSITIGDLPVGQTRAKEGDIVGVSGIVDNSATTIHVIDYGAASTGEFELGEANSAGSGYRTFTGSVTASYRSGLQPIRLLGRNQLGTSGSYKDSTNIRLDQIGPSVSIVFGNTSNGKDYLGLNDTVPLTLSLYNVDSMEFDFLFGDEGGLKTALLTQRTITVEEETFNETGGITVKTTRTANGTSFEQTFNVKIASKPLALDNLQIIGSTMRTDSNIIPSLPRFGTFVDTRIPASEIEFLQETLPTTENQDFVLDASSGYGYFAYPAALGLATFVDMSTGMVGGMDGATWPEDGTIGSSYGPISTVVEGVEWYVYRTDFPGVVAPFLVSFQNPGLTVGQGTEVPHLSSSESGEPYLVQLVFNQPVDTAPQLSASAGTWTGSWVQDQSDPSVWSRSLSVSNNVTRGSASFHTLKAFSASGEETSDLNGFSDFVIAGFDKRTVTFSALSRTAAIGVKVFNATRTRARYAGTDTDMELRTDTRDARASYSIVDGEDQYSPSMGTHIWLSDVDFASANTSGTLQVEIEELP